MSENMMSFEEVKSHSIPITFVLFILLSYEQNTGILFAVFLERVVQSITWSYFTYTGYKSWVIFRE